MMISIRNYNEIIIFRVAFLKNFPNYREVLYNFRIKKDADNLYKYILKKDWKLK